MQFTDFPQEKETIKLHVNKKQSGRDQPGVELKEKESSLENY